MSMVISAKDIGMFFVSLVMIISARDMGMFCGQNIFIFHIHILNLYYLILYELYLSVRPHKHTNHD